MGARGGSLTGLAWLVLVVLGLAVALVRARREERSRTRLGLPDAPLSLRPSGALPPDREVTL